MGTFLIALAAFAGTSLQMMLALADARQAHKEAIAWGQAEDELIKEQPRRHRKGTRKELSAWRDPETDRSLVYLELVVLSWTLLVWASGAAALVSLQGAV